MNTRSSQRRQRADNDGADGNDDLLTRPAIRGSKNFTVKGDHGNKTINSLSDKMTSSLDDSMTITDSFNARAAFKQSSSDSKRKLNVPKTKKLATVHKHDREDVHNDINDHSGSEHSNEEENSDDEMAHTIAPNIHTSSSKDFFKSRPIDDHSQGGVDQSFLPSRRSRIVREKEQLLDTMKNEAFPDRERENTVHRLQLRKARETERLLDTMKHEAYSDDEDDEPKPQPARGNYWIPIFAVLVLVLVASFLMLVWEKPATNEAEKKLQVLTAFQDRFRKLQMVFTGQSPDLWQRSQRILELQLRNGNENKEPAIILLTAAQDAEQMLHCVGDQLANIYASTLNSSYTGLSGLEMNGEDSEDVKMDIDQKLSAGFQANDKAAVLHRIELLPPGSLIILYKYCDHENAAFKNIALVLTVLLKNSTLQPDIELKELEETVHDFLKDTFANQVKSGMSHNQMDGDKLGGLWSRISHVVLPVLPAKSPVKECGASQAIP